MTLTMLIPSFVGISALTFFAFQYFKTEMDKNKLLKRTDEGITEDVKSISANIFYTALYQAFFNLFIVSLPIIINITWLSLSAVNTGNLNNLVTLMSSFSTLAWFAYSIYIGLMIITLSISFFEKMKGLNK